MKINCFNSCFILLVFVGVISCETDADTVNTPPFKQKLIITGYISPSDTISYFSVTTNRKIYGELKTEKPLGLVSGTISDGVKEVALDTKTGMLLLDHKKMDIEYGKNYKLKVSSQSGLYAEAECAVPSKNSFSISVDTFSVAAKYLGDYQHPGQDFYRKIDFKASFTDTEGNEDYYRIFAKLTMYNKYGSSGKTIANTSFMIFDKEFISDKGIDGNKIVLRTDRGFQYFFFSKKDSLILKVYLYQTEKSYYLFHKSLMSYNDGENPFAESSPIYSNINGGAGIFTSYTVDSLVVRYK